MSDKKLSPSGLQKLTNVADLLDNGIQNGSDVSGQPAGSRSIKDALPESATLASGGRSYKMVAGLLIGFALALGLTIFLSIPSTDRVVSGVIATCSPAHRFAIKLATPWYDCAVALPGSDKPVSTLSRHSFAPGTAVSISAATHSLTGVTTYIVIAPAGQ